MTRAGEETCRGLFLHFSHLSRGSLATLALLLVKELLCPKERGLCCLLLTEPPEPISSAPWSQSPQL